jgi:dihydrofolate reductase
VSKLLYSATMSLDGFIAGAGGDMSWLSAHVGGESPASAPGSGLDVGALMASVGALLVGHRTWTGDDPNRGTDSEGAYGGQWQGPQVVLTHEPPPEDPDADVAFSSDLDTAVGMAKEAAGEKYVNVLGADVARQCLEAGVLDEVLVIIAPVLLGDGTRLFAHPGGTNIALERIGAQDASVLWYRVRQTSPISP